MRPLSDYNPTGRFTALAEGYAQHRPGYPPAALAWILEHCGLGSGSLLVDVGSGTGIAARQFGERGVRVLGIEPNAAMRARAEAEPPPPGAPPLVYRDGRAEATGLPAGCADAVLAAQAFHWFEPGPALAEFARILKPAGWAVLIWNERDARDPFTAAYGAVIRTARDAAAVEVPRGRAGEALLHSPLFQDGQRVAFPNTQVFDEVGLLGRAFSSSYAPREPEAAAAWAAALRQVFEQHQRAGQVVLHYETSVYVARRHERAD